MQFYQVSVKKVYGRRTSHKRPKIVTAQKKGKKEGFLDVSFLCAETSFLCAEINEMGGKSICKKDVSFKGRFRALWPSKAPTIIIS